jgi:hypothetical protein
MMSTENDDTVAKVGYDDLLFELKLLSKIKKSDKLVTSGDKLGIDAGGLLQPVIRAYYGDSRSSTMDRIEKLCEHIFAFLESSLKEVNDNRGLVKNVHQKNNVTEQLKQLWLEMSGAVKGLENLKITYEDDASIESQIDLCIDKLKGYIDDITNCLYATGSHVAPRQLNIV